MTLTLEKPQAKKKKKIAKTKVGIFGIKKFDDLETIEKKLGKVDIFQDTDVETKVEVFTYDDDGVTALIRDYCSDKKIKCTVLNTLWDSGTDAGVKRNTEILNKVSRVIIFTDNKDTFMKNITDEAKQKKRQLNTFCLNNETSNYYKVKETRPDTETMTDQKV